MVIQLVLGLVTVALMIIGFVPVLPLTLATTAMFLAMSAAVQRLTPKGQKLYNESLAYRYGLKMARQPVPQVEERVAEPARLVQKVRLWISCSFVVARSRRFMKVSC
jgi:uncharacterized membrane protein YbaN (DUF454 family)